jgi:polyribonucleotide nucleotidyltransferase
MQRTYTLELGGRTLTFEVGRLARQAAGAALVRYGDTVVLATAVVSREESPRDFLPLLVDYREKTYAAGRIPGGFFKREGRPNEKEILSSRLIDRSLRPMFDQRNRWDTMVGAEVLSHDQENDGDVLGLIGASLAVSMSDVPFPGPLGAVRVGLDEDGNFILNPTSTDLETGGGMSIIIAGTEDSIVMVEGAAREISEEQLVAAFEFAHPHIQRIVALQKEIVANHGLPKRAWAPREINPELVAAVGAAYRTDLDRAIRIVKKMEREAGIDALVVKATAELAERFADGAGDIKADIKTVFHDLEKELMRRMVIEEKVRADGRRYDEIRAITCEVGVLPRTHGSALFTRGETQALVITTLGTTSDEQKIEELMGQSWKTFILHYNFPSYSVGEVRPNRGPGRREIGHGALAERSLTGVVPSNERFPYTIRIVSEILESNGSSSMASVCGASLALMDAGVPIKTPVAGIAMGLIQEGDRVAVLSDIRGVEDHLGDMDFKVAGTAEGITGIQMDIKIKGLDLSILRSALAQAREGRLHIIAAMNQTLAASRSDISKYAPRIIVVNIPPDKIRDIIGPGGKMIKKICEQTGATIDVEDDGTVKVACIDAEMAHRAVEIIRSLTEDPEIGRVYRGRVRRIVNFGAFVEILPGRDGLVHISELEEHRVARVEDVVKDGDVVFVKVIGVDEEGKIRLSRRGVPQETAEAE